MQNYLIERRELLLQQVPESWRLLTATDQTAVTLAGQKRGIEIQYCIKSANPAGVSRPSNTVIVV